jgi:hypothetical protein
VNPDIMQVRSTSLVSHSGEMFSPMDKETFSNLAFALENLIEITDTGLFTIHSIHESLLRAQSWLL